MSEQEDEPYCPECDEATAVVETVPWQSDVCRDCGSEIEEPSE